MSPSDSDELSIHELARALGIDRKVVRRNIGAGMPRQLERAQAWRAARVRPYKRALEATRNVVPMAPAEFSPSNKTGPREAGGIELVAAEPGDDLGNVIEWLRTLVKSYWAATTAAIAAGDTARGDALCRQLQSLTRNLAATERVWKQTQERYGGLVNRDTLVRFWMLYKKTVDRSVMELPDSDARERLVDNLDRITIQLSADLKLGQRIA